VHRERFGRRSFPAVWSWSRQPSPSHDCFADEIAIDFPSSSRLLERMRHAFLGERPEVDTLTTEVSLSRRDARCGVELPLEVPVRGACPTCGGRGESWAEPCARCSGTGDSLIHHAVRLSVPAGVAHGARFRFRVSSPHAAPVRVEVRVAVRS